MSKFNDDDLQTIFDTIQIGHANAIKPPKEIQHRFSSFVNDKNLKGDVVIKTKRGYYRPFPMDDIDSSEFSKYIESEYSRGMEILNRCDVMTNMYSKIEEKINITLAEAWAEGVNYER